MPASQLPGESAVSAIALAELAAGPHTTSDLDERARRQERLQRAEALFDPFPFDAAAARAYGRVCAATASMGRKARGRRAVDLLIAASAVASGLPLYTANPRGFEGLGHLVEVVPVGPAQPELPGRRDCRQRGAVRDQSRGAAASSEG